LKTIREKKQITSKLNQSKSQQISQWKKAWSEAFWALNENNFNPRILYPAKLSFKIDRAIKVFHDKQKLKQYMTTKPPLQEVLQGILHTKSESKKHRERTSSTKPQEKKSQESRE
jgi:hypothetical protein